MEAVAAVLRADYGRIFAMLVHRLGDFHLAEDALAEAIARATEAWPRTGTPENPAAWLLTVARNAGMSALRHEEIVRSKRDLVAHTLAAVEPETGDIPDERLRLIFTCCHPALAEEARVALTLHTLCALSTATIARLFFTSESTIAQRLVRAKRKIKTSRIPYVVPSAEAIDDRIEAVLAVVYLVFTAGYARHEPRQGWPLCDEAIRLARVLCGLVPAHAEARGLLALLLLHHARRDARDLGDADGGLEDQDRARWLTHEIEEGCRALDEALAAGSPGPFQIQAAIAALHATAATPAQTDWPQIVELYRALWRRTPTPSIAVALAVAVGMAHGPEPGLAELDAFEACGALAGSDRVAAARADLLRRAGRLEDAATAYRQAHALASSERERRYFLRRLEGCS
jgi:RNA polymerase sigma-70 factor, ECF subfamily